MEDGQLPPVLGIKILNATVTMLRSVHDTHGNIRCLCIFNFVEWLVIIVFDCGVSTVSAVSDIVDGSWYSYVKFSSIFASIKQPCLLFNCIFINVALQKVLSKSSMVGAGDSFLLTRPATNIETAVVLQHWSKQK